MGNVISAIKDVWLKQALTLGYQTVGVLMNNAYPREFELLSLTLELADGSTGVTQSLFTFPIMPESLKTEEAGAATITTTFGGVSVMKSQGFIPKKISISGSFGVNLKMVSQLKLPSFFGSGVDWERDYGSGTTDSGPELSDTIKGGYGLCKLLQRMINLSFGVNKNGIPNTLILYNLAFGESYIVVPSAPLQFNQDLRSNTIWNYNLELTAVCPLHLWKHYNKASMLKIYGNTAAQFGMNSLMKGIRQTLSSMNSPVNI